MPRSTVETGQSPARGMPLPLRSRLTLVVVPGVTLTFICALVAVLEPQLPVALMWFRICLTVASLVTCLAVVVVVLDKHRWAKAAFDEAAAEATLAREQVASATARFERELADSRAELQRQIDTVLDDLAAAAALRAVNDWPPNARPNLSLYSSDTWPHRKEGS